MVEKASCFGFLHISSRQGARLDRKRGALQIFIRSMFADESFLNRKTDVAVLFLDRRQQARNRHNAVEPELQLSCLKLNPLKLDSSAVSSLPEHSLIPAVQWSLSSKTGSACMCLMASECVGFLAWPRWRPRVRSPNRWFGMKPASTPDLLNADHQVRRNLETHNSFRFDRKSISVRRWRLPVAGKKKWQNTASTGKTGHILKGFIRVFSNQLDGG